MIQKVPVLPGKSIVSVVSDNRSGVVVAQNSNGTLSYISYPTSGNNSWFALKTITDTWSKNNATTNQ